jgi:N4-gp56 family major capsid protein
MPGQIWGSDAAGGYLYSDELSRVLRAATQPLQKFRQFCDAEDATQEGYGKALHRGDAFHWDIFGNLVQQGGTLVETNTMPETSFAIGQGTLTITEYGNSVPYTGKLDDFSLIPVKKVIDKTLKNDASKTFDIASWRQFDSTLLKVVPTSGTSATAVTLTTNGTATETNNIAMANSHVKVIVDLMKERNIPPYAMDDYMAISHPSTFRDFKDDLEEIRKYTDQGFGQIMNGEIGRYESTRFIEQNNIPKGGAEDSTTFYADPQRPVADPWNNAKSSWVFFFGADTVIEAMVIPEEMRSRLPSDYGRSKGLAWYYVGGFGIVHTTAEQSRIIKWDSAV